MSRDTLGEALEGALDSGQVFAVVDAAHFEFLQDTLIAGRFTFDPLYLDEVDNPSIASGPHLVHVTGPSQIARLRELVGEEPACVWWVWPDEPGAGAAIRRHLRGLNMIEVPRDRFDADEPGPGYEAVLFRHGDPNVVMAFLPVLYPDQVARLFGKAKAIVVDAPNYHGARVFDAPPDLPEPRRGLLRIATNAQYDALTKARLDNSQERVAAYVRKHLPPQKADMSDAEIEALVLHSDTTGRSLGIKTERGHARWAYLMMMTDGQIATLDEATNIVRSSPSPDQAVKQLIDATASALRSGNVEGLEP